MIMQNIPNCDVFIKNIADKSVLHLKLSVELRHDKVGYGAALIAMTGSNLIQRTDFLLLRLDVSNTLKAKNPSGDLF